MPIASRDDPHYLEHVDAHRRRYVHHHLFDTHHGFHFLDPLGEAHDPSNLAVLVYRPRTWQRALMRYDSRTDLRPKEP